MTAQLAARRIVGYRFFAVVLAISLCDAVFLAAPQQAQAGCASLSDCVDQAAGNIGILPAPLASPTAYISNFTTLLQSLVGVLAVLAFVVGGLMYILAFGDEQRAARGKRTILLAIGGIIIAAVAGLLAGLFRDLVTSTQPPAGLATLRATIINIIAAILYFLGVIAFIAFIWGGYQYVISLGNEERSSRGKRTVVYALIGMAIVGISAVAVNALIAIV